MPNTSATCAASPNQSTCSSAAPCPKRLKTTKKSDQVIDLTGPSPPQVPPPQVTRTQVATYITIDDEDDDDDDDEVEIVDPPSKVTPFQSDESPNGTLKDDDVQVTGTVNEMRLPHMRHHCTKHQFVDGGNNSLACDLCYCYVCDLPVKDCKDWNTSHCNASDKGPRSFHWKCQR